MPRPRGADAAVASGNDRARDSARAQCLRARLTIEPRLQTRRGHGYYGWTPVALRTLFEASGETDHITAEDRRVIACIQSHKSHWGGASTSFQRVLRSR